MAALSFKSGLAALFMLYASSAAAQDITIAVAGPFTGGQAGNGAYMQDGVEAAVSLINARGGVLGRRLRVVYEDDACSAREAVNVANRIVANGISFVFGHFCSTATLAAMNTYAEHGIVQLTISQADAITAPGTRHPGLFRINAANTQITRELGDAVLEGVTPADRLALIYAQDAYGAGVRDTLRPRIPGMFEADFHDGDRDFTAIATRIKAQGITRTIVVGNADKIGIIIRQLRDAGYMGRFFAPGTGTLPDVGATAFCAADGTIAIGVGVRRDRLAAAPGVQAAFATRNAQAQDTILISYTAIETLAHAITAAGSSEPGSVRNILQKQSLDTLIGPLSWTADGNLKAAPVLRYRWGCQNGRAVLNPLP